MPRRPLGHKGLLRGRRAICFPGFEGELEGAQLSEEPVVTDGRLITAKGAGVAVDFALAIVAELVSPEEARKLRSRSNADRGYPAAESRHEGAV